MGGHGQNIGWSWKPALVCRRSFRSSQHFVLRCSRGRRECGCFYAAQSMGGVSVSWSCWEPSCAPAATATVDCGRKGGRAAAWPDGAVRARLSCAGAGWEGAGSVPCPTGPHVFHSLRSWRPAEGPQGPMQGVLAHGRCLCGGFRRAAGSAPPSPWVIPGGEAVPATAPGRCNASASEPARAGIPHRILLLL